MLRIHPGPHCPSCPSPSNLTVPWASQGGRENEAYPSLYPKDWHRPVSENHLEEQKDGQKDWMDMDKKLGYL